MDGVARSAITASRSMFVTASSRRPLCIPGSPPSPTSLVLACRKGAKTRPPTTRALHLRATSSTSIDPHRYWRAFSSVRPPSLSSSSLSSSLLPPPPPPPPQRKQHPPSQNLSTSTARATDTPPPPEDIREAELKIYQKLAAALSPSQLSVQDVSGGCGSMYALEIISSRFDGMNQVKAHRLVNEVLKEEVKGWHGVRIKTGVPMPPNPDPPIGS